MDKFISAKVKDNINKMLIRLTQQELNILSEPNSPYKLVDKTKNGMYIPNGIPVQLIRKYAKKISKAITGEEVKLDTTKGKDKYLMQDALFSLIANYVANSIISTIEFEKVFSGDPAFYSRKTVSKIVRVEDKTKLPNKGKSGVVYVTSDNEKAYEYSEGKYQEIADKNLVGVTRITSEVTLQDGSVVKESIIVDNVWDSYSDKIKRLGSTLSPGDEMRLHYAPEELEKHKELQIKEYTNMNVEDIKAQSVYMDYMSDVFKKQLLIDHIRAIDPDKFKTYCNAHNIKFETAISKIYEDDDFYKEIYNLYEEIHESVENELESQLDPYEGITVADA